MSNCLLLACCGIILWPTSMNGTCTMQMRSTQGHAHGVRTSCTMLWPRSPAVQPCSASSVRGRSLANSHLAALVKVQQLKEHLAHALSLLGALSTAEHLRKCRHGKGWAHEAAWTVNVGSCQLPAHLLNMTGATHARRTLMAARSRRATCSGV